MNQERRIAAFITHGGVGTFFDRVAAQGGRRLDLSRFPSEGRATALPEHWTARELLAQINAKARCSPALEGLSEVEVLPRAIDAMGRIQVFLSQVGADALLVWNGSGFEQGLAIAEARRRGLPVMFGEQGFLPRTMQLDPEGVNYGSSLARRLRAGEHRGFPRDPAAAAKLDQRLAAYRAGASTRAAGSAQGAATLRKRLSGRWRRLISGGIAGYAQPEFDPAVEGRYLLLPLQVTADSQLLLYSPLVGSDLGGLVRRVSDTLRRIAPGVRLVVKLHPRERRSRLPLYREVAKALDNVVFVREVPVQQLIPGATAVITVNSTVGFEAMLLGRPVITVGEAFYDVPGASLSALSWAALDRAIEAVVAGGARPDPSVVDDLIYFTFAQGLLDATPRDASDDSLRRVADRLWTLSGGRPLDSQ